MDKDKLKVRKADLIFSIFLMVMSVYYLIKSLALFINPFGRAIEDINAEDLKMGLIEWYKSPGLLPLVLCIIIFILGVCLFNVARKDGAKFDFIHKQDIKTLIRNKELKVAIIVVGYLAVYIYFLIPFMRRTLNLIPTFQGFPFLIATFIYLAVFMMTFNEKSIKKICTSLLIAALGALVITYGFGNLALIPLP